MYGHLPFFCEKNNEERSVERYDKMKTRKKRCGQHLLYIEKWKNGIVHASIIELCTMHAQII